MKKKTSVVIAILGICGIFLYMKNIGEYPAKESDMQKAVSEREMEIEKTDDNQEQNLLVCVKEQPEAEKIYLDEWEIEHIGALIKI